MPQHPRSVGGRSTTGEPNVASDFSRRSSREQSGERSGPPVKRASSEQGPKGNCATYSGHLKSEGSRRRARLLSRALETMRGAPSSVPGEAQADLEDVFLQTRVDQPPAPDVAHPPPDELGDRGE